MQKITRSEAMWLQKQGFRFGEDVHRTKTKYYAVEETALTKKLEQYRESRKGS